MDNDTIIRLATLIGTTIVGIFTAWIAYKTKQLEAGQKEIKKDQEVAKKTTDDTHKLVNYQSMLLARQHEQTANSLARLTGNADDIKQAETATRLREESEAKQASLQQR